MTLSKEEATRGPQTVVDTRRPELLQGPSPRDGGWGLPSAALTTGSGCGVPLHLLLLQPASTQSPGQSKPPEAGAGLYLAWGPRGSSEAESLGACYRAEDTRGGSPSTRKVPPLARRAVSPAAHQKLEELKKAEIAQMASGAPQIPEVENPHSGSWRSRQRPPPGRAKQTHGEGRLGWKGRKPGFRFLWRPAWSRRVLWTPVSEISKRLVSFLAPPLGRWQRPSAGPVSASGALPLWHSVATAATRTPLELWVLRTSRCRRCSPPYLSPQATISWSEWACDSASARWGERAAVS